MRPRTIIVSLALLLAMVPAGTHASTDEQPTNLCMDREPTETGPATNDDVPVSVGAPGESAKQWLCPSAGNAACAGLGALVTTGRSQDDSPVAAAVVSARVAADDDAPDGTHEQQVTGSGVGALAVEVDFELVRAECEAHNGNGVAQPPHASGRTTVEGLTLTIAGHVVQVDSLSAAASLDGACSPEGRVAEARSARVIVDGETVTEDVIETNTIIDLMPHAVVVLNELAPHAFDPSGRCVSHAAAVHAYVLDATSGDVAAQATVGWVAVAAGATEPDLVVSELTMDPADPYPGQTVQGSATVLNQGSAPAGPSSLCLSVPGISSDSFPVPALAPGASFTIEDEAQVPETAPIGFTVTVVATADCLSEVAERDETNNEASVEVTISEPPQLADLKVTHVWWNPDVPASGEDVLIGVTVVNAGENAAGAFGVEVRIDGNLVHTYSSTGLGAGHGQTFTGASWTAETGQHSLTVVVDAPNDVAESSETNNQRTDPLFVDVADLVAQALTWSPTQPKHGEDIQLELTVHNNGSVASEPTSVHFFEESGLLDEVVSLPAIAPGADALVVSSTFSGDQGQHFVSANVDDANQVLEARETNNWVEETIEVAPADVFEDFDASTLPPSGWTLTGLWHVSDCRALSAPHALAYNHGGCPAHYDTGAATSGTADSPTYEAIGTPVELAIGSWSQTECGPGATCGADDRSVLVSVNGGTWQLLGHETDGDWAFLYASLPVAAGDTFRLRFAFDSVDELDNGFEGWYLDDLSLTNSTEAGQAASAGSASLTEATQATPPETLLLRDP